MPSDQPIPTEQLSSSAEDTPGSSEEAEEQPEVQQSAPKALLYELLIDEEDIELLDTVSAQDLSHAYLLLGNKIYKSLLRPFLLELERNDIFLFSVFLRSIKAFCIEVRMLLLTDRLVVEAALAISGIGSMNNFKQCIRFYERRLAVAHPHLMNDIAKRRAIVGASLQSLAGSSHSRHGLGKALIDSNKKALGEFNTEVHEPVECDKSFELAVLLLSEYLKTDALAEACGGTERLYIRELRGFVAHRSPTNNELVSCIGLFKGNPLAYEFLTSIQNNL